MNSAWIGERSIGGDGATYVLAEPSRISLGSGVKK